MKVSRLFWFAKISQSFIIFQEKITEITSFIKMMLISAQSRQIMSSDLNFTIISLVVCPEHLLSLASLVTYSFAIEIRYKSVACKVVASLVHSVSECTFMDKCAGS